MKDVKSKKILLKQFLKLFGKNNNMKLKMEIIKIILYYYKKRIKCMDLYDDLEDPYIGIMLYPKNLKFYNKKIKILNTLYGKSNIDFIDIEWSKLILICYDFKDNRFGFNFNKKCAHYKNIGNLISLLKWLKIHHMDDNLLEKLIFKLL